MLKFNRISKYRIRVLISALFFACVLAVFCSAADENEPLVIDNFSSNIQAWDKYEGIDSISISESKSGDYFLDVVCRNASPDTGRSVVRYFNQGYEPNLYDYTEFSFDIYVNPLPDNYLSDAIVYVTLFSGESSFGSYAKVDTRKWNNISFDISEWVHRNCLSAVEISITYTDISIQTSSDTDGNNVADTETSIDIDKDNITFSGGFKIDDVQAEGQADNSLNDRFMSADYTGIGGNFEYADNGTFASFYPDGSNDPYIEGTVSFPAPDYAVKNNALRLVIVNASECSQIKVSFAGSDDYVYPEDKTVSFSVDAKSPETSYIMPLPDSIMQSMGNETERIKIEFVGAKSGKIIINAVSFINIGELKTSIDTQHKKNNIGSVTKCSLEGNTIIFKGTLSSSAAVEYRGYKIALFCVPSWYSGGVTDLLPVAVNEISTRFEFKIPADTVDYRTYKFFAAIVSNDGSTFVPIGYSVYADLSSPNISEIFSENPENPENSLTLKGMHADGEVNIFQTGSSRILIDVYCDKLIVSQSDAKNSLVKLHLRDGYYYYFDTEYTRELDRQIKRYSATGSDVILRLLASDRMVEEALTFDTENEAAYYAFNTTTKEGVNQLCAVTDFLSERYSGDEFGKISGFAVGYAVDNREIYNSTGIENSMSEIDAYVRAYADALRLVYRISSDHIPNISVYASISDGYIYSSDTYYCRRYEDNVLVTTAEDYPFSDITGMSEYSFEPLMFTELLTAQIKLEGEFDFRILYSIADSPKPSNSSAPQVKSKTDSMLRALNRFNKLYSFAPESIYLMWEPENGCNINTLATDFMEVYRETVERHLNKESAVDAVMLSLSHQSSQLTAYSQLYAMLKYVDAGMVDTSVIAERTLYESVFLEDDTNLQYTGKYSLWDFSNSYNSQGWFEGEGCSYVGTRSSEFNKENQPRTRILRAAFSGGFKESYGNAICALESPVDLSLSPFLEFSITVYSENETADVLMVIGSGMNRAEYKTTVETGKQIKITADLTDFEGISNIEYISLGIIGQESSIMDIEKITAFSVSASSAELRDFIVPNVSMQILNEEDESMKKGVLIAALTVIISVIAVALMSRRQNEP